MAAPRFQLIPGGRIAVTPENGGGVAWRLLGPNNRELGRAARVYPDAESAHDAISRLRHLVATARVHVVHRDSPGQWAWTLDDEDGPIAVSGRGFRHERECRQNLDHFREAAPTAATSDGEPPAEFPWQRTVSLPVPSDVAP